MYYKIYKNMYFIDYTYPSKVNLLNKTVIIQNLDNKYSLNGQIGTIKKTCKHNYFIIKLNSYISLKSTKPLFLKIHNTNLEIIH